MIMFSVMNKKCFKNKVLFLTWSPFLLCFLHTEDYAFCILKIHIKFLSMFICASLFLYKCIQNKIFYEKLNFSTAKFFTKKKRIVNFFNYTETRSHFLVCKKVVVVYIILIICWLSKSLSSTKKASKIRFDLKLDNNSNKK